MRTIFYADDDVDDFELFSEAIKRVNLDAIETYKLNLYLEGDGLLNALSGSDANSDLVFLDINMSKQSGFDLLVKIRNNEHLKALPVIMYSTSSNPLSVDAAFELGANAYAVKTTGFSEMITLIKKIVETDLQQNLCRSKFVIA